METQGANPGVAQMYKYWADPEGAATAPEGREDPRQTINRSGQPNERLRSYGCAPRFLWMTLLVL